MLKTQIIFFTLIMFLLAGMVPLYAETQKKQVAGVKKAEEMKQVFFPRIKKYNIALEVVSPERTFEAGKPAKITFRLRNYAIKPLVVYEWYAKEFYNIRLFYIPWKGKMKKPKKSDWIPIIPKVPPKAKHQMLELTHRNSVLIDIDLPFVKNMQNDGLIHNYIVFAELNLTSISAKSEYIKISVRPPYKEDNADN